MTIPDLDTLGGQSIFCCTGNLLIGVIRYFNFHLTFELCPYATVPTFVVRILGSGVGTGGARGAMTPPPMLEGGGQSITPPQFRGPIGPLGPVFFTLENVLCLLFESAIPGGKKYNIDHIL